MIDFTTEKPTESGWYDVIWQPGEEPVCVWVFVSEWGLLWGWDEHDDPEAIELDIRDPDLIQFRKVEPEVQP